MKKIYLFFSVVIVLIISFLIIFKFVIPENKIKNEVESIYAKLNPVGFFIDLTSDNKNVSYNGFKEKIRNIGSSAIPYLYECVNNDKDSLKQYYIGRAIADLFPNNAFDTIKCYNEKYKSKNVLFLNITIIHYILYNKMVNKNFNFTVPEFIIPILIEGTRYYYDIKIYKYVPLKDAESLKEVALSDLISIFGMSGEKCFVFDNKFRNLQDKDIHTFIKKWWEKYKDSLSTNDSVRYRLPQDFDKRK
jgi:hypothetical protein